VEEGEEVDIGACNTILVERTDENGQAVKLPEEEPDFMKYIKNMNLNYVNTDYLKEHFAEEEKPA
jgi:hypothetical protein